MNINDDKKIDILLDLLNERYGASHRMRERSMNFAIWILGFGIAMIWMLLSQITLTIYQKILLTVLVIMIGYLTRKFLKSIEVGFDRNREVILRIEKILGCYEVNTYIESTALFPNEYRDLYNKKTSHFKSLYIWVWAILIILLLIIWAEQVFGVLIKSILG